MEENDEFKVKVGEFEGPLDLLLFLIEKRKLCVNDISLAEVTDGYIEYVKTFEDFPVAASAEFLIVASTLMLIKSLSLLPDITLTGEEKDSIEDLEARLALYKDIKKKSVYIKDRFGKKVIFSVGLKKNKNEIIFAPTGEITKDSILASAKELIRNIPPKENISEVKIRKVISLEEAIESLSRRIQSGIRMKFSEFVKMKGPSSREEIKANKINIVVSFLAMLELIKRGAVRVTQESHFSEINLELEEPKVPQYGSI